MNEKPIKAPLNGPVGVERSGASAVTRADSLIKRRYRMGRRQCAVVRNRIRRLMRENIRLMQYDMRPGQYVFIARAPAAQADYKTFHKSLRYIFRREGLLLEAENGRRQDS